MSLNYHRLYLDSVFALAETLVIKSEYSAETINDQLRLRYGPQSVDNLNPQTWKYYLNLCGEYHITDEPIMVLSLDTMQNIALTKQNLLTHVATARGYRYGSRYHRELVSRYPTQELLIMGILYPATMDKLLASPDMQVVAYPTYLVEENEETLILDINDWLTKFKHRWHIPAFSLTDELYGTSILGVMYAQLVPMITTLRLKACRTARAHSYHVRQYLASHGMLDSYLQHLTRSQAMFFYRNAAYIERNSGKASTLAWLTEQVLTVRGLPLSEYKMKHKTTDMPTSLTPEVVFVSSPLNSVASTKPVSYSTAVMLGKESPLATGNPERIAYRATEIENTFKYALRASAKTKILESSMVSNTASAPSSIQDVALALWGYSAATGGYSVYARIKNPQTGAELTLSMLQAYYYFFYAYCQVHTLPLQTVPEILAQRIPRWPAPTLVTVMNHVDTKYVSQDVIVAMMNLSPPAMTFVNSDLFKEGVQTIHDAVTAQSFLVARQEHFYAQGIASSAFLGLYGDHLLRPADTGEDIHAYLSGLELPTTGFTPTEWQQVYLDLFKAATGFDMQSASQSTSMQKAMVRLMSQLSSYSVQFVSELAGDEIKSMNWPAIRFGDSSASGRSRFEILAHVIEILEGTCKASLRVPLGVKAVSNSISINLAPQYFGEVLLPLSFQSDKSTGRARIETVIDVGNTYWDDRYDPNALPSVNNTAFEALSPEEVAQIPNLYNVPIKSFFPAPTKVDLNTVLHTTTLTSFQTHEKIRVGLPAWTAFWGPQKMRYFADESTVVVLNGIWPFGGEQTVDAFNPAYGTSKFNSFKYVDNTETIVESDGFIPSGGQLKTGTFTPGKTPSDHDAGSLHASPLKASLGLGSVTQLNTDLALRNKTALLTSIQFTKDIHNYELAFTAHIRTYTLPDLHNVTKFTYLHFDQFPQKIDLKALKTITISHKLGSFTPHQNVWHMAPFTQLFMAQGPVFIGRGVYNLDHTYTLAPSNVFNNTVHVALVSDIRQHEFGFSAEPAQVHDVQFLHRPPEVALTLTPGAIQVQEIELASKTKTLEFNLAIPQPRAIEIPDFSALFYATP